jgi:hypothetical protein
MESPRPSYNGAIWSQWCRDVKPEAANAARVLKSGVIGIAAGLIVAQQTGKMNTATNAALTTATVLGVTLVVTMVVHLLWSWATAPRKVFCLQEGEILSLQGAVKSTAAERDAAIAKCNEPKLPKTRRGDRNDVIQKFRTLASEGGKIQPNSMADIAEWKAKAIACVRECLFEDDANQFADPGELKGITHASQKEQAKQELSVHINRLASWTNALAAGRVDHCIREFYVPLAAIAVTVRV